MANSNVMQGLCAPALLYLIFAIISVVIMLFHKFEILSIIVKVLFITIWTWFLNFLCSKGHTTISWILVLLPFILMVLMILFAYEMIKKTIKKHESFTDKHKKK